MGFLERWDQRNQETAEYHNETAASMEEVADGIVRRLWVYFVGIWVLSAALGGVLRAGGLGGDTADVVRMTVLIAIAATLLLTAGLQARRKRAEWRRDKAARLAAEPDDRG